jgi:divalent metal cation (Fe/Co/Zn/Cd) transporter
VSGHSGIPRGAVGIDVSGRAARQAVRLEQATIAYNVIEGIVAVSAGLAAGSVALVGFGFDSGIEVAAASVVLWRLRSDVRGGEVDEARQRLALRFIAVTFFVLAGYVLIEGVRDLVTGAAPDTSPVGIALTGASIIIMPALGWAKTRAGQAMNSPLVIADAAETKLCAWLSVSTFAGLVAFAALGWTWIDAVAGFVIAGFAISEGREAWEGELTCHDRQRRPTE